MSNRQRSTSFSVSVKGAFTVALAGTSDGRSEPDAGSRDTLATVPCVSATPSSPAHLTLPTHPTLPTQDGVDLYRQSGQVTPTVTLAPLAERDPKAPPKATQGTQGCKGKATVTVTEWEARSTVYEINDDQGNQRQFTTAGAHQDQIATETSDASTDVASEMPGSDSTDNEPHAKAKACATVTVTRTEQKQETTWTVHSVTPGAPDATEVPGLAGTWARDENSGAAQLRPPFFLARH